MSERAAKIRNCYDISALHKVMQPGPDYGEAAFEDWMSSGFYATFENEEPPLDPFSFESVLKMAEVSVKYYMNPDTDPEDRPFKALDEEDAIELFKKDIEFFWGILIRDMYDRHIELHIKERNKHE